MKSAVPIIPAPQCGCGDARKVTVGLTQEAGPLANFVEPIHAIIKDASTTSTQDSLWILRDVCHIWGKNDQLILVLTQLDIANGIEMICACQNA